jgi:hypothetical protein
MLLLKNTNGAVQSLTLVTRNNDGDVRREGKESEREAKKGHAKDSTMCLDVI